MSPEFVKQFNEALKDGLDHINQLIYLLPTPEKGFDLKTYFNKYISYNLDAKKKKALTRFLKEMSGALQPTLTESLSI